MAQPDLSITVIVAALTFAASVVNAELPQDTRHLYAALPALVTTSLFSAIASLVGAVVILILAFSFDNAIDCLKVLIVWGDAKLTASSKLQV